MSSLFSFFNSDTKVDAAAAPVTGGQRQSRRRKQGGRGQSRQKQGGRRQSRQKQGGRGQSRRQKQGGRRQSLRGGRR